MASGAASTYLGRSRLQQISFGGWSGAVSILERFDALLVLILLSPFLIALAIAIRLMSGVSPLIAHRRIGMHGHVLWVLKFRTMWEPAGHTRRFQLVEKIIHETTDPKESADPRVASRFAFLCRRYSLDELPQLLQVVIGEMSLVGPRPITRSEFDQHYGSGASQVLSVKPGLTGLWQVKGRSRLTYRQRRRLDLFLVHHWSPALYLKILLYTIPKVLIAKDAW